MIIRMHLRFCMGVGRLNTDHCIGLFLKYISWFNGGPEERNIPLHRFPKRPYFPLFYPSVRVPENFLPPIMGIRL
jgi:hypothetical protein